MPNSCKKSETPPKEVYGMRDGMPVMVYYSSGVRHKSVATPPARTRPQASAAGFSAAVQVPSESHKGLIALLAALIAVMIALTIAAAMPIANPQHSVADVAASVAQEQVENPRGTAQEPPMTSEWPAKTGDVRKIWP